MAVSKVWLFVDGSRDWRVVVQEVFTFTGGSSAHASLSEPLTETQHPRPQPKRGW